MHTMENDGWHQLTIQVPFANQKHAEIAKRAISADPELQPQSVERTLTVDGRYLTASFSTETVRLARLTMNSFLDNIDLVVRTLGEFADETEHLDLR